MNTKELAQRIYLDLRAKRTRDMAEPTDMASEAGLAIETAEMFQQIWEERGCSDQITAVQGFGVQNCDGHSYLTIGLTEEGRVIYSTGDGKWCRMGD